MLRFVMSLLCLQTCLSISALRFGPDSASNDISIIYDEAGKKYTLIFQKDFYYHQLPFTICFRLRPVLTVGSTCVLTNQTGPLDCTARDPHSLTYLAWTLSSDYKVKSNVQIFRPHSAQVIASSISYGLSLDGIVGAGNTSFNFVGQANSIFEVLAADSYDLGAEGAAVKQAYVSTFYDQFGKSSDNLIMPTQMICTIYEDIINLAFVGGRHQQGRDIYIAAFINYNPSQQSFLLWEGLSFAKNKVNRDMMAAYPSTGEVYDLFSLYKTAPFLDTSTHVNGTNDWNLLASSSSINSKQPFWFYYTQAYRKFNTGDTNGDEALMFKIGNQYCFAAYFQDAINSTGRPSITNKTNLHQVLKCFDPVLTLSAQLAFPLLLIFAFLL